MKALILIADGFEDLQLFCPWFRLQEEGIEVKLAAPFLQTVTGQHGYFVEPDTPLQELNPSEYDLLLIPGGTSPEKLRIREEAVDIARTFVVEEKIVAAIGHGPQLLISAQTIDRRGVTCSPGIRDDVRGADAIYRDEGVHVDGNLITCRGNEDLAEFCQQLVQMLSDRVR